MFLWICTSIWVYVCMTYNNSQRKETNWLQLKLTSISHTHTTTTHKQQFLMRSCIMNREHYRQGEKWWETDRKIVHMLVFNFSPPTTESFMRQTDDRQKEALVGEQNDGITHHSFCTHTSSDLAAPIQSFILQQILEMSMHAHTHKHINCVYHIESLLVFLNMTQPGPPPSPIFFF